MQQTAKRVWLDLVSANHCQTVQVHENDLMRWMVGSKSRVPRSDIRRLVQALQGNGYATVEPQAGRWFLVTPLGCNPPRRPEPPQPKPQWRPRVPTEYPLRVLIENGIDYAG